MNIIDISLTVASLITAGLSLFIIRGEKRDSNNVFTLFILSISLWAFGILSFRLTTSLDVALYYTIFYYIAAAAIPVFFLHFSYIFPVKKDISAHKIILIYIPLFIIAFGLLLDPNLIIKSVYLLDNGSKSATVNTTVYVGYAIYFISFLVIAYINLFRSYFENADKKIHGQIKSIILGTSAPYLVAMYFDLISPTYDYTHIWIGPLMAIIVVLVLLQAVYKQHFLNARVITTEIFIACLWVFIIIRILLAETNQEIAINLGLLFITVIVGMLLVRSVNREIKTRERIESLVKDLESSNTRLTELNRQKSEFVSFASHQLRAPLTAMKGYASLLLEGDMGALSEEAKMGVSRIFDSTNTLVSIVNDYLNLSRIELGTMSYVFETIDLKMLVDDAIAEVKPNIDKAGVEFTFKVLNHNTDYRTTADRDKLKQVIANLIDNSIKYTPSGSVNVTLGRDSQKQALIFSIKDTGVGISSETLPRLFKKFSRAQNASKTNIRGTGLGLYVAKQIVDAHHGNIYAQSPGEGKGSTFTVELEPFIMG